METYREEQRFDQVWLRVLVAGLAAGTWMLFLQQVVAGNDLGGQPPPDWLTVVLLVLFGLGFPLWFFMLRLVTVVDESGVDARFKPVLRHLTFRFDEIVSYEAVEYHPLKEFGGWGVRSGRNGSKALNTSGNLGVRIVASDQRMYLIGSQTPDELVAAIRFHTGHHDPGRPAQS